MLMMEKDGKKEFVFDCFIPYYRSNGWKPIGEADNAQPPSSPPESETEDFVCPHCGKSYKKESSLEAHIKKTHAEE